MNGIALRNLYQYNITPKNEQDIRSWDKFLEDIRREISKESPISQECIDAAKKKA